MPTEKEMMLAGEMYDPSNLILSTERNRVREKVKQFNDSNESEKDKRQALLKEMLGSTGETFYMEPTIRFDYGYNIHIGENFYSNYNLVILDVCEVRFGDNCMLGPNVAIYTATHPLDPTVRNSGREYGKPVRFGDNVWIGGNAVINPGITIGDNAVIASGAVVVKDVPQNSVVGGNPARVLKTIEA
ncbi:sugar O-acetyltransferase [Lacticigenium naphthae]|uniref:sugar O-acetyltransferase n=1 Tax=Lacticigenium naphthae TaxID=515351 RepID=UPI00040321C9|nr:sugar O-acetyltransferase [Lacticigenium naphthae]